MNMYRILLKRKAAKKIKLKDTRCNFSLAIRLPTQDYPPDCYYCDQMFNELGKSGYQKHVVNEHPGKPGYPGPADIEFYKLTPKGMVWEN